MSKTLAILSPLTASFVLSLAASAPAAAAKGASAGGKIGTSGAKGSADGPSLGNLVLPERVIGGNAISTLMPLQVGFAGYMPRVRLGFQYDLQLYKQHWAYAGAAALFDRADYRNFRLDECGLAQSSNSCQRGAVAGFDLWAGWAYKFYLPEFPFLVPIARVGLGGGWWKYPNLSGSRQQTVDSAWSMSVRGGGGVRFFLLQDLALGVDLNLVLGFKVTKDIPLNGDTTKKGGFLLGMEILPLLLEYRF
jgi:hypothetical protein